MNKRFYIRVASTLAMLVLPGCSRDVTSATYQIPDENYSVLSFSVTPKAVFVLASTRPVEPIRDNTWGTALLRLEKGQWREVFRRMGTREEQRPLLVDLSKRSANTLLATGVYYVGGAGERSFLLLSRDAGETWMPVLNAPESVYGAEVFDESNWISWDSGAVYFTADGGEHWHRVGVSGRHIRGGPRPCVLPDKSVLMSVCSSGSRSRFDTMEWIAPGAVRHSRMVSPLSIRAFTVHRGDLYAMAEADGGNLSIERLAGCLPTATMQRVASLPGKLGNSLQSSGESLVAYVSTVDGWSVGKQLLVSVDQGAHWRDILPWFGSSQFKQAAAADDGAIWLQSSNVSRGPWIEQVRLNAR